MARSIADKINEKSNDYEDKPGHYTLANCILEACIGAGAMYFEGNPTTLFVVGLVTVFYSVLRLQHSTKNVHSWETREPVGSLLTTVPYYVSLAVRELYGGIKGTFDQIKEEERNKLRKITKDK